MKQIAAAQVRRGSRRMLDNPEFKSNVEGVYAAAGSSRNDNGGWDTAELKWLPRGRDSSVCEFEELDPTTLSRKDFLVRSLR